MKKREKLTVLGMALYCAVVFCAFLAWGLKADSVSAETLYPGQAGGQPYKGEQSPLYIPQLSEGDFGRVYAADASEERQPEQTSAQAEICMVDLRAERSGPALCRSMPGGVDRSISGVSDAAEAAGDREGRPYGHAGNADRQSDAERGMLETANDDPDMGETDPGTAVHVIENCTITYYCCEKRAHICGTGDGITATGAEAAPGVTCAVDPAVIPFGSLVCVDYGDGVLHEYVAQDSGAWVNEDHVDLCVETHSEALELGRRTATVYWTASEN